MDEDFSSISLSILDMELNWLRKTAESLQWLLCIEAFGYLEFFMPIFHDRLLVQYQQDGALFLAYKRTDSTLGNGAGGVAWHDSHPIV